ANTDLRQSFSQLSKSLDSVICVESFGMQGYFSAMKHAKLLLGNTSSGITEAASFGKYVVNLGDRQKGRTRSENVVDCEIESKRIIDTVNKTYQLGDFKGENVFSQKNGAALVIDFLKQL
ncbi:MAG: UDP-N-acetylglucosamine 2-epimerase (hydrolyzing), partial [Bacteroidia bacterium]|nr:UDP-N-acetylglucosamine 2-epimerase (hydrolyzing) [Bacteroidia bacterium]